MENLAMLDCNSNGQSEKGAAEENSSSAGIVTGSETTTGEGDTQARRNRKKKKKKTDGNNVGSSTQPQPKLSYAQMQEERSQRNLANLQKAMDKQTGEKPGYLITSNKPAVLKLSGLLQTLERCEENAVEKLSRAYSRGNSEFIMEMMEKPERVKTALDQAISTIEEMLDDVYLLHGFGGGREKTEAEKRVKTKKGETSQGDNLELKTATEGTSETQVETAPTGAKNKPKSSEKK